MKKSSDIQNIQLFSLKQAASYCNKSYESFRYYIKIKRSPEITFIDMRKFFTKDALDAWNPEDNRKNNKAPRKKRKYED